MLLLASCVRVDRVELRMRNSSLDHSNVCSGGLQATFQAGSLIIQSPKVKERELFDKVVNPLHYRVGIGTPVTVKVWCYDADTSKPTGYIHVEKLWRQDSVNAVSIYAPSQDNRSFCIGGVIERTPVPCVVSHMLK